MAGWGRRLERTLERQDSGTIALIAGGVLGVAGLVAAVRAATRHQRKIDFAGKVVLVTGGSRGLGLILSRRFAAEGAKVVICARDADELARAQQDITREARETGHENPVVATFVCDLLVPAEISTMISAVQSQVGPVDVLVYNAGTIVVGPMETMTEADYQEALNLHFWGAYHCVQAVLPGMRARRASGDQSGLRIGLIASVGGKIPVPHMLPYSTSKFALVGFGEGLHAELAKDNIRVTTICPGMIRTGSPRNAFFKGQHRKEYAWFKTGDSLPLLSQSADAAANEIVDALRHGDAELTTSTFAKVGALVHGVAPGLVADAAGFANRYLPAAEGEGSIGTERRRGADSESAASDTPLVKLSKTAEAANNQLPG